MDIREYQQQQREYRAWQDLFNEFCRVMNITKEEGNKDKYRNFFCLVDTWGEEYAKLRIIQRENGSFDIFKEDGRVLVNGEQ